MTHTTYPIVEYPARPFRALIEIHGAELRIYPVGESEDEEKKILDALRFICEDFER